MSKLKVKKIESIGGPLEILSNVIISGSIITNNIVILSGFTFSSGSTVNSTSINNTTSITTKDLSASTVNSSNVNTTDLNVENIVSNNIEVNGSINADTYYGDGSNLSGIPFIKSLGQNSLKQVGVSYDKNNLGLSSASLGDFNSSNGNYSVSLGYNNNTGPKPYDFLPSYSGKYGIILDPSASKDFSTQQVPQSLSTTAITTGITVISSTTLVSNTVFIQNGVSGCTRYYLQNNKNENFTVVYTDCDTGLSARTTLNAFSNIEVCSLTRPCIDHYRALDIKLYENGSPLVLGNNILENQLINYALCQGYNVIQIYGLYGIFGNVALSARLEIFLNKLYSVGLLPVAIMGCGTAGFDLVYLWEVGRSCRFWGVNKECEFWNGQEPFATWIGSINYINATYPNRWNVSAYVANPGGGNWGAPEAAQMIAANMDVIQCTNYISNLPQREPNPADADFLARDLQLLANAAKNANVIQDFVPLWSSEPVFAGPYFGSFPPNLTIPISRYNLRYNNLNFNNEDSVCKIGFNMFRYEEIINYLPYSLCNITGTGLTPTTSYAQLSGHTKIIDVVPISGCCNYISYTTYTSITTTTTIITGSTQIIPSNSSNPLCIRYSVYYLSISGNTRPGRIFYTDCTTGRRKIYFAPATPPSANTINYICSLTYPRADLRLDPSAVGIKPHSICCECIQYRMTGFSGTTVEPIYLSYTPCGSSTPIDVTYNYGDIICMSPFNYSTHYFYYIPYFTTSGPVIVQIPSGSPYFLENTNICCSAQTSSYFISSSSTVTTNIYSISACTNLSITNLVGQNCSAYKIQNNTSIKPSFSYINCKGEYEYISGSLGAYDEIIIGSLVTPTIHLNTVDYNYLNNIIISSIGSINSKCVNYEFKKIALSSSTTNVYWTDCFGILQSASLKNINDSLKVCLILGSQEYGSDILGTNLGECINKNSSTTVENYVDPNTGLITITENIYNNCEVYDEYSNIYYPLNVISIESGYSDDGTIKILGDVIIYSGLTGSTGYTILEFKDAIQGGYFSKIINTTFGHSAIATGDNTLAKGNNSFSQNKNTIAYGESSHAEGLNTISNGFASHSEGIETKTKGIASHSEGYGTFANGDYSKSSGVNTTAGSKEYDFNTVINGKYIVITDNASDQFTTSNLSFVTGTTTINTGTTTISSSTVTIYRNCFNNPNANNCINYSVANNTSSPIPFTYRDCSTGLYSSTTIQMYSIKNICSLVTPTYTTQPWMSAFDYPVGIVAVGTCCNTLCTISSVTQTVITTYTTGRTEVSFFSGCSSYSVTNNRSYPLEIYYTGCNNTFTTTLLPANTTNSFCSKTPPAVDPAYGLTAITSTLIGGGCCKNYSITNPYWCVLNVFYTNCTTGLPMTASTYGYGYLNICSSTYPTYSSPCSSQYSGVYPNITLTQNACGHQYTNVLVSTARTTSTRVTITTGCTSNNSYFTGATGCTNYLITNYVPNDPNGFGPLIVYTNCLGGYESIQPTLGQSLSICSSNVPVPHIWPTLSGFSNNLTITPTGTCETLCVKYRFTRTSPPPSPNAIWDFGYNDCDYNFQTGQLRRVGDFFETCIILGSQIINPGISAVQVDTCSEPNVSRLQNSEEKITEIVVRDLVLTNATIYDGSATVRPINIVNIFTGYTTGGTVTISASTPYTAITGTSNTIATGTTTFTSTTITTGITNIISGVTICTAYTETTVTTYESILNVYVTGNTLFSGITIVTGTTVITGITQVDCNQTNNISGSTIITGTTILTGNTIITGSTIYTGLTGGIYVDITGSTFYTILELNDPLVNNLSSGTILSNGFGIGAVSTGLETQSKGNGSFSQNILTKAVGDGSHAEGINTTANGKASHSAGINSITNNTAEFAVSNGGFGGLGGSQYSIVHLNGFTSGNTSSYLYVDGISEHLKIEKNTSVFFEILISATIVKVHEGNFISGSSFASKSNHFLFNTGGNLPDTGSLTYFNDDNLEPPQATPGFTISGLLDNTFTFAISSNSGSYDLRWSAMLIMIQTKF